MTSSPEIRESATNEAEAILALYPLAFPDEDLTGLVAELLPLTEVLSLVATHDDRIIGHAIFTRGRNETGQKLALLGPIGVHPNHQSGGLGKALIAAGAARLNAEGADELLVLGDPDYYSHRGFDVPASLDAPYPLKPEWAEAWRSMLLVAHQRATGSLALPEPWMKPEYWA